MALLSHVQYKVAKFQLSFHEFNSFWHSVKMVRIHVSENWCKIQGHWYMKERRLDAQTQCSIPPFFMLLQMFKPLFPLVLGENDSLYLEKEWYYLEKKWYYLEIKWCYLRVPFKRWFCTRKRYQILRSIKSSRHQQYNHTGLVRYTHCVIHAKMYFFLHCEIPYDFLQLCIGQAALAITAILYNCKHIVQFWCVV